MEKLAATTDDDHEMMMMMLTKGWWSLWALPNATQVPKAARDSHILTLYGAYSGQGQSEVHAGYWRNSGVRYKSTT